MGGGLLEFFGTLEGPGEFVPVQCDVGKEEEVIAMMKIGRSNISSFATLTEL